MLAATALLLSSAACSSSSSASSDPRDGVPSSAAPPSVTPTPVVIPTAALTFPLTGQPAPDQAAQDRAIVAVAVESGTGASAVAGIGDADLVFTSFPGSGRQRSLALFQSRDSARVGPVADTRPVDGKLLRAVSAVLEHSGGTSGFIKQVERADLPEWSSIVHPSSFTRDPSGAEYGSTTAARAAVGVQPGRPGLLAFRDPGSAAPTAPPGTTPASVRIAVPGQDVATLTYDAAAGVWRGSVGALPVVAADVVVQVVEYAALELPKTGGRTEGNPLPDGQGVATLLTGPVVDTGTWNRAGGGTSTKYLQSNGNASRLVPGTTWVLLAPAGTTVTPS